MPLSLRQQLLPVEFETLRSRPFSFDCADSRSYPMNKRWIGTDRASTPSHLSFPSTRPVILAWVGGPIPVDAGARFSNHSLAFCARRGCRRGQDGGRAAVGKLVPAPTRCPRGHALRPDRTLLRTVSCSCGRHTTWRCHWGEVIYRPVLSEHCRLLNGRASTRRGQ